ncbi:hypothetical protein [Pseudomonas sp. R16(2017)]|uniref:hypothetical protein n=1 Tax=Pseudomonas sp. R16(2017) TaxID=1981704 RepID=UPI000A1DDB0F|nr:hypothetical protein [Pseudomonas sp. R16(2017)]
MEEMFIVQKRPAHGVLNGFYYRVVDVRTGQAVNQNFMQASQAEAHCQELNKELVQLEQADLSA